MHTPNRVARKMKPRSPDMSSMSRPSVFLVDTFGPAASSGSWGMYHLNDWGTKWVPALGVQVVLLMTVP